MNDEGLIPKRFVGALPDAVTVQPAPRRVPASASAKVRTLYRFRVRAAEVTDGDTYQLTVDPGLYLTARIPIRLDGYDTPEKKAKDERERAKASEAALTSLEWLVTAINDPHVRVWVETDHDPQGGFGRWVGNVWLECDSGETEKLGDHLVEKDLATFWPQRWHQKYLPKE